MERESGIVPRVVEARLEIPGIGDADGAVASWGLNDGFFLHGFRVGGLGWLTVPGVAGYRFDAQGPVEAVSDGGSPDEIEDTWLRSVMPYVIQARGTQVLHASAVATERGVVALCGESMAGKSTLAAGLMMRGRAVVADDALAFSGATVYPLPFQLRLRASSRERLGLVELAARSDADWRPSRIASIVLLHPHADDEAPLSSILRRSDAVGRIMPHAYAFSLDEGKDVLVRAYTALVGTIPLATFSYPQSIDRLHEAIDGLEACFG